MKTLIASTVAPLWIMDENSKPVTNFEITIFTREQSLKEKDNELVEDSQIQSFGFSIDKTRLEILIDQLSVLSQALPEISIKEVAN